MTIKGPQVNAQPSSTEMEVALRALALEELALHPFPGVSFERLCRDLQEEHQLELDAYTRVRYSAMCCFIVGLASPLMECICLSLTIASL